MKRATLQRVVQKCVLKPVFFRALVRNPKRALDRAKIHLTSKDLKKLERLVKNKKAMKDFSTYLKLVKKYSHTPYGILW